MHEPLAWPVESEKKKATQKSKVWDTKFTLHIANCKPTPFWEHICTESDFGSLYLQNISLHKKTLYLQKISLHKKKNSCPPGWTDFSSTDNNSCWGIKTQPQTNQKRTSKNDRGQGCILAVRHAATRPKRKGAFNITGWLNSGLQDHRWHRSRQ